MSTNRPPVAAQEIDLRGVADWLKRYGGIVSGPAGGDFAGNYPNPSLKSGIITPGTTAWPSSVTVDSKGRITGLAAAAAAPVLTGAAAGGDLTGTYPNPTLGTAGTAGTYYGPSAITTDTKGRVTAVTPLVNGNAIITADYTHSPGNQLAYNSTSYLNTASLVATGHLTPNQQGWFWVSAQLYFTWTGTLNMYDFYVQDQSGNRFGETYGNGLSLVNAGIIASCSGLFNSPSSANTNYVSAVLNFAGVANVTVRAGVNQTRLTLSS